MTTVAALDRIRASSARHDQEGVEFRALLHALLLAHEREVASAKASAPQPTTSASTPSLFGIGTKNASSNSGPAAGSPSHAYTSPRAQTAPSAKAPSVDSPNPPGGYPVSIPVQAPSAPQRSLPGCSPRLNPSPPQPQQQSQCQTQSQSQGQPPINAAPSTTSTQTATLTTVTQGQGQGPQVGKGLPPTPKTAMNSPTLRFDLDQGDEDDDAFGVLKQASMPSDIKDVSDKNSPNHHAEPTAVMGPEEQQRKIQRVLSELQNLEPPGSKLDASLETSLAASKHGPFDSRKYRGKRIANLKLKLEDDRGCCEAFMDGTFEYIMGSLIVISALLMSMQLYWAGISIGAENGWERQEDVWEGSGTFFEAMEHIFNAIFVCELFVKFMYSGTGFLYDRYRGTIERFNAFDLFVVAFTTVDLWVMPVLIGSSNNNLSFVRLVRLIRLSRGLKVIRVMKVFSKLRILVRTVASSFGALIWSMVLLGVLNFGGAIFLCQLLQSALEEDETLDEETRAWLYRMYGTAPKAIWTMFEFTFSGGWPSYARTVVEEVHWGYSIFFIFYVSVVVFAVTRIITALFLKDTLQVAANDADMMVQESMASKARYSEKLRELFELADTTGDGYITLEEFEAVCRIPEVHTYFHLLELEVQEVAALFSMLDDGEGYVSYTEFMRGIFRLKGQARSMDVIAVMRDCHEINERCKRLEDKWDSVGLDDMMGTSKSMRKAKLRSRSSQVGALGSGSAAATDASIFVATLRSAANAAKQKRQLSSTGSMRNSVTSISAKGDGAASGDEGSEAAAATAEATGAAVAAPAWNSDPTTRSHPTLAQSPGKNLESSGNPVPATATNPGNSGPNRVQGPTPTSPTSEGDGTLVQELLPPSSSPGSKAKLRSFSLSTDQSNATLKEAQSEGSNVSLSAYEVANGIPGALETELDEV